MVLLGFTAVVLPGVIYLTAHIAINDNWQVAIEYCLN